MRNLMLKTSGFTLIGALAAAGISMIVFLGFTSMFNMVQKSIVENQAMAEIIYAHEDVYTLLNDSAACLESLRNSAARNSGSPLTRIPNLKKADGVIVWVTGNVYWDGKIILRNLELGNFVADNPAVDPNRGVATLKISFEKPGDALGPKVIGREVRMVATRAGGTNLITGCIAIGGTPRQLWVRNNDGTIHYPSGNVGIGNTNPTSLLHVNGNANLASITAGSINSSGNINSSSEVQATTVRGNSQLCIGGSCRSSWPVVAGGTCPPGNVMIGINPDGTPQCGFAGYMGEVWSCRCYIPGWISAGTYLTPSNQSGSQCEHGNGWSMNFVSCTRLQ